MNGWRTAVIQDRVKLSVKDQQLIVSGTYENCMPIDQLRQIMITSPTTTLTASAITMAAKGNIHVILCGEKHTPVCEIVPIGQHHEAAGAVIDQTEWIQERKNCIWKAIVELKLRNQLNLLRMLHRDPSPKFKDYMESVTPGDQTNREAVAARMYFDSLFGCEFRRHAADETNAKLNYGYTILNSAFSRILAMHGYHTGLGIHHCNRDNAVNLSCDLMEPFRPFVDKIVFESGEKILDWEMKKKFISLPATECHLDGNRMNMDNAIEIFALETLKAVKKGKETIPEVTF